MTRHQIRKLIVWNSARLMNFPNVEGVATGFKERGGKKTDELCIVVNVTKKIPLSKLESQEVVPQEIGGAKTDIQQTSNITIRILPIRDISPLALSARRRPSPCGWSLGHKDITAGTQGAVVWKGNQRYILTNNHVAAKSNGASIGDAILQPGPYDGGLPVDRIATLSEFVVINFPGQKQKDKRLAMYYWRTMKWLANFPAATFTKCPNRLVLREEGRISQPDPNLVDAALCRPVEEGVVDPRVGKDDSDYVEIVGIREPTLGEPVKKWGRTTELTDKGYVAQLDLLTRVSYGGTKIATFGSQGGIKTTDGSEFSAGGDSGSAILSEDNYLIGLLFAGGEGITVFNPIQYVVSLLGVRL